MNIHDFLFKPGVWLGEGTIHLSVSEELLKFSTRWRIDSFKEGGPITAVQEIQIYGIDEIMKNKFTISLIGEENFKIQLENEAMGQILGEGLYSSKVIAWEFRTDHKEFEGFEVYEVLPDHSYYVHAEYTSAEDLRTQIKGKIWKKST